MERAAAARGGVQAGSVPGSPFARPHVRGMSEPSSPETGITVSE
jgi:hypothetical protein